MARSGGWLFFSGAALGLASLLLGHRDHVNETAVGTVLAVAGCAGLATLVAGGRIPRWLLFHLLPTTGTLLISLLLIFSHDSATPDSFFYIWVSLWAVYFLPRVMAFAQVSLVGIAYALVLAVGSPGRSPGAHWVVAFGTVVVSAGLVGSLAQELRQRTANMSLLLDATRALAAATDADGARPVICEALKRFGEASMTALYEPEADGAALRLSATSTGAWLPDKRLTFVGSRSAAVRAFVDATPIFVGDLQADDRIDRELVQRTGMGAGLWHPVLRRGAPAGVLAAFWAQPLKRLPRGLADLTSLLATEAATTIDRADLMRRLAFTARTDDLTRLPNRRAWGEELPLALRRAARAGQEVCVAMLDLDRFKTFNDEHGHQAGDRVLKEIAAAWSDRIRSTDILARYGGEEFALVLPDCGLAEAIRVVEQLRAATPRHQTCSVGVALWDGSEHPDAVLSRADAALYQAKSAGRNRVSAARSDAALE